MELFFQLTLVLVLAIPHAITADVSLDSTDSERAGCENQECNRHGCGDWGTYKDDRCFKIFKESFKTFAEGSTFCQSHGGTLPTIESFEEQNFFSKFVQNETDNVWLGAKNPG
jgi:hypothetical protein